MNPFVLVTDPAGALEGTVVFPGGPPGVGRGLQIALDDPSRPVFGASLATA